jgi:hypothetical protein
MTLVMTPPPTTVKAKEMISLSLRLIQEGKQENQLVKVKQVPLKPMRKLPTELTVMPCVKGGGRERVEIQKVEYPLRPDYEYNLRRVDRRHPHKPTDFTLGENQSMVNRNENPFDWTTELHDHHF